MNKNCSIDKLIKKIELKDKNHLGNLKEINHEILKSAIKININNIEIKPKWVEIYYKSDDKNYRYNDSNTHHVDEQKNNAYTIYFHRGGYRGIDLVFSKKSDYSLSVLVKLAELNGVLYSQIPLMDNLIKKLGKKRNELVSTKKNERKEIIPFELIEVDQDINIVDCERVGLTKKSLLKEDLASFNNFKSISTKFSNGKKIKASTLYNNLQK